MKSRMMVFARHASGQAAEVLVVLHDVTEQRLSETALVQAQRQESLGALTRGALHDLNNTLMGIQGFTEIALAGLGHTESLRGNLEKVRASMLRASALSRQMGAYVGSGSGRLQIAPRQLNEAVRDSLPMIESLLPPGGHLELDLAEDLPLAGLDPAQARYALLHLVFNAAEAIRVSGGQITLCTRVRSLSAADTPVPGLEGRFACLEVRDSGQGKAPGPLEQIYDPLFPARWPAQGLGLSAVQGILREHRGGVQHVSEPGRGETTTLYFPLAERVPVQDEDEEGTPVTGVSGVILLVEDDPTVRAILRQGLEVGGFKVIEAADGVEGLHAFVRHRSSISLVLLDLTMPRRGGDEVFQEIHQLAPEVPVVLMSGYSEQEATSALASRGLAGFLAKPCSIKDALAVVGQALRSTTAPVS
jgi:CheY-like chemotaxis protein/nitrogen-specific signal transduction histidine kinase